MFFRPKFYQKMSFFCKFVCLSFFLFFQLCYLVYSEPQFASSFCIEKSGTYTNNSLYRTNLNLAFSNLTSASSVRGFSNFTSGDGVNKVYALFYCRGDLKLADCHDCVETAITRILFECPNEKEAIVFFEECTFRYANRSIFSLEEEDPNDWSYSKAMVPDKDQFNDVLTAAISDPMNQAAFNKSCHGFATGITANSSTNQTVYSLAQCTPDILGTSCHKCLEAALGNLLDEGKTKMSLFMPSCQVMYSLAPFFNNGTAPSSSPVSPAFDSPADAPSSKVSLQSRKNTKLYVGVGVGAAALGLLVILFSIWFWMHRRTIMESKKDKHVEKKGQQFADNVNNTFTYEELAIATDNFSDANLLGQGGFGYVHKGVLPDGKMIAVKQLKTESRQGEREFQAEVETISRVHHRHLVSLVGYCILGDHRLLVYEFIPNKTLEYHLREGIPPLSWGTRLKIAIDAAKGLAYLHEDCHPKIIHRDIKAANILIDNEFEAKVADFGLAKFFSETETHVTTRVMGTFGYLAPEYAASGKLTDKSDVFSFGVLLLEIITGRKPVDRLRPFVNDNMVEWARPLLAQALEGEHCSDLIDPKLKEYNSYELNQMIACAAACVRASAKQRPRMSQVVQALEGNLSADDLLKERQEQSTGEHSLLSSEHGVPASSSSTEFQESSLYIHGR